MHGCTNAPFARTRCCTQYHHHLQLLCLKTESTDLYQMFPPTKDSCTVNRTSICNHLCSPPQL